MRFPKANGSRRLRGVGVRLVTLQNIEKFSYFMDGIMSVIKYGFDLWYRAVRVFCGGHYGRRWAIKHMPQ